ncbi:MAG: phosphate ABC transporter ATP-binding protein [Candidatus Omnitrophica bacterium]|nr:phosphate ABC transporter ATP-binding protein [Candidatus Omnitrophota bacterium]
MTASFATTHISIKGLNVYYGKDHALKDITVEIPDKKITVIIGPSGCGKTTLLRSFNRLLDPADNIKVTGKVVVGGEDLYDPKVEVTHVRKKMGLLSQKPYPLPMSIYDNIAYGPRLHGENRRKNLDKIVEHFLRTASLWDEVKDKLYAPASKLSVGQQQRLCLARGLAVGPEIILGDEPTSALDPRSSRHIEERFLELKQYYTIILVTHILRQARRLADYVLFLYMGRLIEHGPAREIFENPKEEMTREYMQGVIS